MCAMTAGRRGRTVLILEHADKAGQKVRISGGGHCNFTNLEVTSDHYFSLNPHFSKSALARFSPGDFVRLVEKHGIEYHKKESGRLFCKGSAGNILTMLKKECDEAGVEIRLRCRIEAIRKTGEGFSLTTNQGEWESESLVIATGGLSFPRIGATDMGYRVARKFGLKVTQVKPALVPFTLSESDLKIFKDLSGLSIDAGVICDKRSFQDSVLFTHKGLSGPAMLQASLYWTRGNRITVDLLPGRDALGLLMEKRQSRMEVHNLLSGYLPRRFVQKWFEAYFPDGYGKPVNQCTDKELKGMAHGLQHWEIIPSGTEGYRIAEVTAGGISTEELSSGTMESKKVPGLYFIGEVLDVTGQLGGYNLHWAWASGYTAGQDV